MGCIRIGRPSIVPEKLLRALLLRVFYTVRSERLLMEEMNQKLLVEHLRGMASAMLPTRGTKNVETKTSDTTNGNETGPADTRRRSDCHHRR